MVPPMLPVPTRTTFMSRSSFTVSLPSVYHKAAGRLPDGVFCWRFTPNTNTKNRTTSKDPVPQEEEGSHPRPNTRFHQGRGVSLGINFGFFHALTLDFSRSILWIIPHSVRCSL